MKKKVLIFLAILCLFVAAVFGFEVTERYRLGAVVEAITYIENGSLTGKLAFMDGWSVYVHDLMVGGYEKLFSVAGISFQATPRGIAFISQGDFAGNFLLSDNANSSTLFLVSDTGSLVGDVHAQGLQWFGAEGLTQITGGPYQGDIALLSHDKSFWHIYLLHLEQSGSEINAYLDRDIPTILDISQNYLLGITYLPADFPDPAYANMFAVSENVTPTLNIFNDQGTQVASFPGVSNCEGLAYISNGAYREKFFITDSFLLETQIRNLDGSLNIPVSLPPVGLGLGIWGNLKLTWLRDRQQMMLFHWDGTDWSIPTYLISRLSAGEWRKDNGFRYTRLRDVLSITDMTAGGTYQIFGIVSPRGQPVRFEVQRLDADFGLVSQIAFPSQYTGRSFGSLVYVPGETIADDRYITPFQKSIYSFDANFNYPAVIIDLKRKVTNNISRLCYDSAVKRFYVLDGTMLRAFDAAWHSVYDFDLSEAFVRPLSSIAKFTSGDLRGQIAVLNVGDDELIILNFEYQIAGDLLNRLSADIRAASLPKDIKNSLTKKLDNALKSAEKKNPTAAVNQIEAFQSEVRAQGGKKIPAELADAWLERAAEIIRGLQAIL